MPNPTGINQYTGTMRHNRRWRELKRRARELVDGNQRARRQGDTRQSKWYAALRNARFTKHMSGTNFTYEGVGRKAMTLSDVLSLNELFELVLANEDDPKNQEFKRRYNNLSSWLSKNKGHEKEKEVRNALETHKAKWAKYKAKLAKAASGGKNGPTGGSSSKKGVGKAAGQPSGAGGTGSGGKQANKGGAVAGGESTELVR